MSKTLCVLTCLDKELEKFSDNISVSFSALFNCFGDGIKFLAIVQCDLSVELECNIVNYFDPELVVVKIVNYRSISMARNDGIEYAQDNKFAHIIFHDVSIVYSANAAKHFFEYKGGCNIPCSRPYFSVNVSDDDVHKNVVIRKPNPLVNPYVWAYIFPVKDICKLRFDENFGPGVNTQYKSGEDLLFLTAILDEKLIVENRDAYIFHPPRPVGYEKHLLYAEGQGKVLRILLGRYFCFQLYFYIFAFFLNALIRVVCFRRNSINILLLRCKGFFG